MHALGGLLSLAVALGQSAGNSAAGRRIDVRRGIVQLDLTG